MNFAPCLDVNSNPNNPIIGERAFSDNPTDVINGYDTVFPLYQKAEIIPVIKHFPGHGDADKDSHKELPKIELPRKTMEEIHIKPFKHAIKKGADAVMVAHLHATCFDKTELPTSLSKNCINYLNNTLGFNGVVISDDMYMKGVAKYGMTEACLMGIDAGINLFIYRDSSDQVVEVIENTIRSAERDTSLRNKIEQSAEKISRLKAKYNIGK
jgi:beta-N-acetylhexosaminidase